MSDLDRIKALAGLATDSVAESTYNETKMVCKDCGDELHNPTTDCPHDSHDENGDHWIEVDIDGDGDTDIKVARDMKDDMIEAGCDCDCGKSPCEACGKDHHEVEEAVGDAAESFYKLQDEYCGGECESGGHKTLIDELVRYLSGDQLEDFVSDFRRHHDMDNMEEAELDEDDLDENAFNQAAAAAKRAGKSEFEFNGKKYKTTMDKSTAHQLDDDVQFESEEDDEETLEEGRMKDSVIDDSEKMSKEEFAKKHGKELADEMYEAVVSEAPTMDTTQLITLLKNAGLTEEAIEQKLTEWANTPEGVGEVEPTVHGGDDNYEFAQMVNLSLKKYLDAQDMKVQVSESEEKTAETLTEAYKNFKK